MRHGTTELPHRSIPDMIRTVSARHPGRIASRYRKEGEYADLNYGRLYERILMAGRGLKKAGIAPGDRVAIFSENRLGWIIADMGIMAARAISVPIYDTNTPEQAAYVINHTEARIVFISGRVQYEKLLSVRDEIPSVEFVVSIDRFLGNNRLPVYTLFQLSEISHPITEAEKAEIEADIDEVTADDVATIIYTSGTTGRPKGVMLTHGNILFDAWYGQEKVAAVQREDTFLSFLPLSHAFERTVGYYLSLMLGCTMAFAESVEKVPENMLEIRPTVMISVPRLFEKIYSRIHETVHQSGRLKRVLFHRSLDLGKKYVTRRYVEKRPLGFLGVRYRLADMLIFRSLRKKFGGRIRFFVSGGAPLDRTVNEFFWSIGLPILEGYGLTETSPAFSINTFDQLRFGTVGTLFPHVEARLAEDNELLVRGPMVMKGYFKDDEATKSVIDDDGWVHTGDIAVIDDDGFIAVVDRKKEIIVTAGGKNIAPQPIENAMKLDKYISQVFIYGDARPYLVALVVPNFERLIEFARDERINYLDISDLVVSEKVVKLFNDRVCAINRTLPRYETIKKIAIVPQDFTIASGELTPTLKIRRKVIVKHHRDKIERLYADEVQGINCADTQDGRTQ